MEQDRRCSSCNVEVSSDLSNCPLCGKHITDDGQKPVANHKSYPIYDLKFVDTTKWYNVIRVLFWIAGIICVIVNLIFKTQPFWCPYVLAALVMVFHVFIEPIKVTVSSYIKNLTIMSILVSLFLIFIDAYNHFSFDSPFGWALGYVAPFIMTAGVLASTIICFCSRKHEVELMKSVSFVAVFSVIYFLVKIIFFSNIVTWPSLVFMCVSLSFVVVLELFKRHKLVKELSKEFHI